MAAGLDLPCRLTQLFQFTIVQDLKYIVVYMTFSVTGSESDDEVGVKLMSFL